METLSQYKSKNIKIDLFEIPIYDFRICFLKYKNNKGYDEALLFCEGIGFKEDIYKTDEYRYACGFTTKQTTKTGIIAFVFINNCKEHKDIYINTLSHETFHLVNVICKHHGIVYDAESDNEPIAYLTGYLYNYLSKL